MSNQFTEKRDKYYHRQVVNATGLENAPIAFGAEKTCHIFKSFVVFREHIAITDENFLNTTLRKLVKFQNTQYLANYGINTPRIVDIELKEDCIYEVQERATGQVLSYTNESNILHSFGEKGLKYVSIKDMSDSLRSNFCLKVLEYNFNMQKKLKSAPISQFIKFLRDFKDIQEYGLDLDIHGENFLYDTKEGFSFIDLPSVQSTTIKKFDPDTIENSKMIFDFKKIKKLERYRDISDFEVLKQICNLFVDFLKYSSFVFDQELIKKMKKNNLTLIENKIFEAAKLAGFNLTEEECQKLKSLTKRYSYKKEKPVEDNSEFTV